MRTLARYTAVNVAGVSIDLLSAGASLLVGVAETGAVGIGVAAGTVAAFLGHERFTFRMSPNGRAWRALRFVGATAVTLGVRYALLGMLPVPPGELLGTGGLRLLCAVGASFAVGFVLSKALVFRSRQSAY